MKVTVNRAGAPGVNPRAIRKSCMKVMRAEKARKDAVVSVSALDEAEISVLNLRYLSRQGPTDVLAFPLGEESEEGYLLGDVVICPEKVMSRREEYGVERGRELEFVAAHGVMHLLGYEDDDEEGAEIMERRLREILGLPGGDAR
ncbi:MAG: rRNA maturation RNase YbeY [Actinomycetota bacterium]|nr:rRNA maturation RNase YbeY [Actinomycetota bacterium]MDD5665823.1 rRNA maturation RNase YbeY [Actinomycetota bacterium]